MNLKAYFYEVSIAAFHKPGHERRTLSMKIPFNEEATLEYINQEEEIELSSFDRLIGSRPWKVFTTEELSGKYKKQLNPQNGNITFAPFKLNLILLVMVGLAFTGFVVKGLLNPTRDNGFAMLIPLALFLIIGILAVLFDPKRNFKIVLSKDAIIINDFSYNWHQVNKFYIVRRRKGKGHFYFLILALDTGLTDRYDFTNLMGFGATDEKLSAYIEYYKNDAIQ